MSPLLRFVVLLSCSNVFMTFAWYAHLKNLHRSAWYVAALVSWGIAFFEYLLQVPANRAGAEVLSLGQLKIVHYMKQPLKLDYLWAVCCILGAVYFVFRSP
jgi:uncharacterized protein